MLHFRVIAGLGNPGRRYERTRHNAGFMVADALADALCGGNPSWLDKGGLLVCEGRLESEPLMLCKPQSFMNRSGMPLGALMAYYKLAPQQLVVAHDDIDLPLGRIRIKQGGGSGGHNGLKSISQHLSSEDYARVRVGVGRPAGDVQTGQPSEIEMVDWVLSRFSTQEANLFEGVAERAVQAVRCLCLEGLVNAQNRFN